MNQIIKSICIIPIAVVIIACGVVTPVSVGIGTETPAVSQPTLTPAPVPTTTPTPLPTLGPEDREKLLAELLRTNGNCSKPCFWGISPDTSAFDDSVAFLKSLGSKGLEGVQDSTRYYNVVYNYKDNIIIGIAFSEQNGK